MVADLIEGVVLTDYSVPNARLVVRAVAVERVVKVEVL